MISHVARATRVNFQNLKTNGRCPNDLQWGNRLRIISKESMNADDEITQSFRGLQNFSDYFSDGITEIIRELVPRADAESQDGMSTAGLFVDCRPCDSLILLAVFQQRKDVLDFARFLCVQLVSRVSPGKTR